MKKIKITEFSDGQHGWIAVKRKLLVELGIEKEISRCSYQRGETVYLEEDVDAGIFYHAFFRASQVTREMINNAFEIKRSYSDYSPIRNYAAYSVDKVPKLIVGLTVSLYGRKYLITEKVKNKVIVKDLETNVCYKLKTTQHDDIKIAE